jgi:alkylation response protein AidB-like acyl-CoA dehydrogenase
MQQLDTAGLDAFRKEVRASLEAIAPPAGWRDSYATWPESERDAFDARYRVALREAGWLAAHWPKDVGGRELGVAEDIVLKDELQRVDYPPVGRGIAFHHAAATIARHGTAEQRERLPAILDGEVWCQGFSEPGAGSDLASLRTRAVREGDHYVVNGQKVWSSGAHRSQWCLLLARTDPSVPKHKGLSMFMMDMASPGVEVRPIRQATGGADFNEIFMTDVVVPASHRLGPENDGWRLAQTTLTTERGSSMIENQVALVRALDMLAAEARCTPWGAGRTAWDDAAVRFEVAERAAEVHVLGMLVEKVVGALVEHGEMGPESSTLKLFYSETLQRLTELAMRLRGPAAWLEGGEESFASVSGNWAMDHIGSWVWTIAAGSNEIQRNIIAERVLGLPREKALN